VGFEQTTYTFAEDAGNIEVCTRYFQPSQIDSRVVVELQGTTTPDTADGEIISLNDGTKLLGGTWEKKIKHDIICTLLTSNQSAYPNL